MAVEDIISGIQNAQVTDPTTLGGKAMLTAQDLIQKLATLFGPFMPYISPILKLIASLSSGTFFSDMFAKFAGTVASSQGISFGGADAAVSQAPAAAQAAAQTPAQATAQAVNDPKLAAIAKAWFQEIKKEGMQFQLNANIDTSSENAADQGVLVAMKAMMDQQHLTYQDLELFSNFNKAIGVQGQKAKAEKISVNV